MITNNASPGISADGWDSLVERTENSKFYHLYEWGLLLEKTCDHRMFYLAEKDGVLPLALVKSRIFGNRLISLPFADYGGLCAGNHETAETLVSGSKKLVQESGVDFLEIRSPDERYSALLQINGFLKREDYCTYILPLSYKPEELWKIIGGNYRKKIVKAEENRVWIKTAAGEDDVKQFYQLYLQTMKRLGSPPQPYRFFFQMWKMFSPKNLIMPLAIYENKCIAGGIFFLFKREIHYAYGCSSKDYLHLSANNLFMWWIIKWGSENGFLSLDFGRTRAGSGHDQFKRHWGGACVPMYYYYLFNKTVLPARQEIKYKALSGIWSKYLPDAVANKIGPWVIKQVG